MSSFYAYLPSLSTVKNSKVYGTCEDAFLLSLRDGEEFSILHSYGCHRVPHIGVYGNNYSLTVPLVLLSLPPTTSYLKQLPPDILNALDVDLDHHYQSMLMTVAKELVRRVLQSSVRQVGLINSFGTGREVEYRVTGASSFLTTETEEDACTHSPDVTPSMDEMEDMETIRLEAKKIVRKAIHLACKKWESQCYQESVEYLVASAKRLRIQDSPSPTSMSVLGTSPLYPQYPLTHKNKGTNHDLPSFTISGNSLTKPTSSIAPQHSALSLSHPFSLLDDGQIASSQLTESYLQKLGKKRPRSDSHEANMMRDLNKLRSEFQHRSQLVSSVPEVVSESSSNGSALSNEMTGTLSQLLEKSAISDMVAGIMKMSIMEVEQEKSNESEDDVEEESYIILDAVTKPSPQEVGSPNAIPMYSPLDPEDQRQYTDTISTSFSAALSDKTGSVTYSMSPGFVSPIVHPDSHSIADFDYFFILHSYPSPGPCQKFTCGNTNEVNVVYHCWMYPDIPLDPAVTVTEQVEMGVFEPSGVLPVHLDLQDSGVAFCYLENRSVCVHECCFSPENAQLQLCRGVRLHTFFSVARHGMRRVVTFHAIPASQEMELLAHQVLAEGGETLAGLLDSLQKGFPELLSMMQQLLSPLWST